VFPSHSSRKRNGISKSSSRGSRRARVPARSRRFSAEQHAHALSLMVAGMKREQVAKTIGCTTESLRRRYADAKQQGLVTKLSKARIAPLRRSRQL
jgi:CRP-like cAMP-binding protein